MVLLVLGPVVLLCDSSHTKKRDPQFWEPREDLPNMNVFYALRRPRVSPTSPIKAAPNIPNVEGSGASANCSKEDPKSPIETEPLLGPPERCASMLVVTATEV
jgi:hypothetical protein